MDCIYKGSCCFRGDSDNPKECTILADVHFDDGLCHFRKTSPSGPNLYDMTIKRKAVAAPERADVAQARSWALEQMASAQLWVNRIRREVRESEEFEKIEAQQIEAQKESAKAIKTILKALDYVNVMG